MLKIGCHLSSSKGYLAMGKEAVKIGANTFQFFTRNPRGGKAKPMDLEDMAALKVCLLAMGTLLGLSVPFRWKKPAALLGSFLFVGTYLPLMVRLLECLTRTERET